MYLRLVYLNMAADMQFLKQELNQLLQRKQLLLARFCFKEAQDVLMVRLLADLLSHFINFVDLVMELLDPSEFSLSVSFSSSEFEI